MTRLPAQLIHSPALAQSWTTAKPTFLGLSLTPNVVTELLRTEKLLEDGVTDGLDPRLCRALAAWHGPKGDKVPLSTATVTGCLRPAFTAMNPWLSPASPSCYDGGCYLYHARAVPAKKSYTPQVCGYKPAPDRLVSAASLARHYSMPIRDNQSSDGSLSMTLNAPGDVLSLLHRNLLILVEAGHQDVPYLCMVAAYVRVPEQNLRELSAFKGLIVHLTVSGWHSIEENLLRLDEFERYASILPNVLLRVVNRMDWAEVGISTHDSGARVEKWLLSEIRRRELSNRVIRTPFHSVHPFPGGRPGALGTRHMAGFDYTEEWSHLFSEGASECCTTGKCKTCPTRCGAPGSPPTRIPLIAARALDAMLSFETARQASVGPPSPLAIYTARLIARKGAELYAEAGDNAGYCKMVDTHSKYDRASRTMILTSTDRRRLANDSHALVMNGMDRHRLWVHVESYNNSKGHAYA